MTLIVLLVGLLAFIQYGRQKEKAATAALLSHIFELLDIILAKQITLRIIPPRCYWPILMANGLQGHVNLTAHQCISGIYMTNVAFPKHSSTEKERKTHLIIHFNAVNYNNGNLSSRFSHLVKDTVPIKDNGIINPTSLWNPVHLRE